MYRQDVLKKLTPFIFFDKDRKYNIVLKDYKNDVDRWKFEDIKLKPILKRFLEEGVYEKKKLDYYRTEEKVVYPYIFTTKISNSWLDGFNFNFYLNGQHINSYDDLKVFSHQGYIYICSKTNMTITSLIVVNKNISSYFDKFNNTISIEDTNDNLELPFNESFVFDKNSNNGNKLVINHPYFILNHNENLLEKLYSFTDYPFEWLSNNKIFSYLLIDDSGILDISDIEFDTLNITNKKSNSKLILFYNGISPEGYVPEKGLDIYHDENYYCENIFRRIGKETMLFLKDNNLFPNNDDINIFEEESKYDRIDDYADFLLGFSYDLFMEGYKRNHKTKYNFKYSDLKEMNQTNYSDFNYELIRELRNRNSMLKISFYNPFGILFDLYFNNRLSQINFITQSRGLFTDVFINISSILDFFDITYEDLKNSNIMVLLKNKDYKKYNYNNIDSNYNGTLPIGQEFFKTYNKRIYDNGYILKEDDYILNSIYPSGLVCLWPKRHQRHHNITVIGNHNNSTKITRYEYTTKINGSSLNKTPGKQIYKGLLYTDYIDFRFNVYIGPYLLQEGKDYIILAPNLIELLKDITVYKEDINNTEIPIIIEYEGELEDFLLEIYKHKSYKYRLFNNDNFINEYIKNKNDINLISENLPELYDDIVFRFNMMNTKYFASEPIEDGNVDSYGEDMMSLVHNEFEDLTTKENDRVRIMGNFKFDLKKIPRRIISPEPININTLIMEHIEAVKILKFENKTFNNQYDLSDENYRWRRIINTRYGLWINPNIPIYYILEKI